MYDGIYIWSLYIHYVYLLIYWLSVIRSLIFFNIKYEYNITLNKKIYEIVKKIYFPAFLIYLFR